MIEKELHNGAQVQRKTEKMRNACISLVSHINCKILVRRSKDIASYINAVI